jgi:hypothetical protein
MCSAQCQSGPLLFSKNIYYYWDHLFGYEMLRPQFLQNIPQVLRFQQAESKDFQPYPIIFLVYVKVCAYIPPLIETLTEIKKHICKARS